MPPPRLVPDILAHGVFGTTAIGLEPSRPSSAFRRRTNFAPVQRAMPSWVCGLNEPLPSRSDLTCALYGDNGSRGTFIRALPIQPGRHLPLRKH